MENGSRHSHLFKGKSTLTWAARSKIAQDLASELLYLHEEWEQCVVHRDIKSSNILLDSNFNTKLGDFGLAKLCGDFNEQMDRLTIVGLWSAHPHSRSRASIRQVFQTLNFEASVPIHPSEMPLATYLAPSMNKYSLQPCNDGTCFGSSQIQSLNFNFNTESSKLTKSSAAASSSTSSL
ncbi:concanavalin A-like lectin protein kinase family protein [Actinidia rufa]|uniref:non-specific serine/threonine protein kinase n=1 Tax=Actinidia rufa TaxID=165716 RepID=A0A7J0DGG3_9ERIC|nr:concanavalin A-like lectin protein kinase family protein [Actinidia rufa]